MSRRDEFLAGERPDDVAFYLAESAVDDLGPLESHGERTGDGIVVVVDGETGRSAFATATGEDAMAFARKAMQRQGTVAADLSGGECPDADEGGDHGARIVFAFVEEQNEEVGGRYAEGDVVHAYAQCECGAHYTQKWVVGER